MFTFNPLVLDHLLLALAVSSVLILTVAWRRRRLDAPKNPPSTDGDPIPYGQKIDRCRIREKQNRFF